MTSLMAAVCRKFVNGGGDDVSTKEVAARVGATARQLSYWRDRGWLHPAGSSHAPEWPPGEVEVARTMARLVAAGVSPERAHHAARHGGDLGGGVRVVVEGLVAA